ncbi:lysM domain-containing GPI-anchored protein 1-like isoform X2 [Macadamia integrifolia]|uniref:lysM domain-containing GPI-anchored protein 1-like isoform X2 n=1 Tax=Macadamia integrifolia TaxID=60698 RepID=UPI001C4EEB38|nr:lysM domain-containing GPI-anchored protein 1-like isoform X2 [Macadamia integrifolia]
MILNKMKIQLEVILFLLVVLLIIFPSIISGKSVIEPCNSSDSCNALLSYLLPWDSKLSEISSRFQVNVTDILASNSLNPTISFPENQIFPANSLLKVPISCPCVDGIRRSVSTNYTVGAIDTVDSISAGYGGLVSADQIKIVNGIDDKHQLMSGMSIVIPLPCMCFNNSINGITTVFMSYVVQRGESLSSIGATYSATVTELEAVNGLLEPVVHPGDVLAVPNPACSSANLDWYNESLIVPNGSYALTANNCIMCRCGVNDKDLANSSQIQCSGNHSVLILPPCPPPTLHSSEIPLTNAPVSSSPSPASAYNLSDPSSRKSDNISSDSRSFRDTSYLFPPRLALLVCFVYLLSK